MTSQMVKEAGRLFNIVIVQALNLSHKKANAELNYCLPK